MDFWTVFIAGYVVSTIFAIAMTYREQQRRQYRTPVYSLIGYLLCTVWPVFVAVVLIVYRPMRQENCGTGRLD